MGDIRVLIVDDHAVVRLGVRAMLAQADDIVVVGECTDGGQVVQAAEELSPDVVVMDLRMPVMDGVEATRALLARRPNTRVLILTANIASRALADARAAGAVGALAKGGDPAALVTATREVAAGRTAWPGDQPDT